MTAEFLLEFHSRMFCEPALGRGRSLDPDQARVALLALVVAAAAAALSSSAVATGKPDGPGSKAEAAPAVAEAAPPLLLKQLSAAAALEGNRRIGFSHLFNPPAPPFRFTGGEKARARALSCLTSAIYYESARESDAGQQAVAQVVLNRVRSPPFPASVCGVVFQGATLPTGCQFTFTCDGSLMRRPEPFLWGKAQAIADAALSGRVFAPVGLATHYHADYVVPYWATSLAKEAQIGAHIFYIWPQATAFADRSRRHYSGREPDPELLTAATLMAHGNLPPSQLASAPRIHVSITPGLALAGVAALLARPPGDTPTPFETDARSYFAPFATHPAVQLLKQWSAADGAAVPDSTSLEAALDSFAQEAGFDRFFEDHRSVYRSALDKARQDVTAAAVAWERYSAIPVDETTVPLSARSAAEEALCVASGLVASTDLPAALWPVPSTRAGTVADVFINSGLAGAIFAPAGTGPSLERPGQGGGTGGYVQQEIVRAVFARAAALTLGEAAGEQAIRREVARGHARVPEFAERLRSYEMHREQYPTLRDFLPQLLNGTAAETDSAAGAPGQGGCPTILPGRGGQPPE